MGKFKGVKYLLCLALFFGVFGSLLGGSLGMAASEGSEAALPVPPAQEEPPPSGESLEIYSRFPKVQNLVGTVFEFEVTLFYEGSEARTFALDMTLPEGWQGLFMGGFPETEIQAFTVEPGKAGENIRFFVAPLSANDLPGPGEYVFTVSAATDNVSSSIDLEAVVIPASLQYQLYMSTTTLRREFAARPDQENHISIELQNVQTGSVDNIQLSAEAPADWDITFTPSEFSFLEMGVTQEIDVVIVPPSGVEAGDYPFVVKAVGDQAETERLLTIQVVTGTATGAVGIGVTAAIIAGLIIWFRRAGRR